MTTVRFVRDEVISEGPQRCFAGQEIDLPDTMAQHVIQTGAAVAIESEAPIVEESVPEVADGKKPDETKIVKPSETKDDAKS